jgi:hypothetical protein
MAMFQLTQLQVGNAVNISYSYSVKQNNGKIVSQNDAISGEEIDDTYDALNRLALALTVDNPNVAQWGQSHTSFNGAQRTYACAPTYDGFGNLTDQTLIKGTAPDVHVAYDPATNRQTSDIADANGNLVMSNNSSHYVCDGENRLIRSIGRFTTPMQHRALTRMTGGWTCTYVHLRLDFGSLRRGRGGGFPG